MRSYISNTKRAFAGTALIIPGLFLAARAHAEQPGATGVEPAKATFTSFQAPGAGTGATQGTLALNINAAGVIVGSFLDSGNVFHCFERAANGTFTTIDIAGAGTAAYQGTGGCWGINATGVIAGNYIDSNNAYHGFVRAADGTVTGFNAPGAGTGANQGTFPYSINSSGAITGFYWDSNGVTPRLPARTQGRNRHL